MQTMILSELTERDPSAGLARLSALASDLQPGTACTRIVNLVFRGAAEQDPSAALAAVEGLPEELHTQALGAALVGWAGKHPVDALTWAQANGVNPGETKAVEFYGNSENSGWNCLITVALESDRARTMEWILSQPASPLRDAMLSEDLGSSTPEQSIETYSALTPEGRKDATETLVTAMVLKNQTRVEAWVKDLPNGPERRIAVQSLANAEARNALENSDELADSWPAGPDRNSALRGIALAQGELQRGLTFVRRIEDPTVRATSFAIFAQNWLVRDETAARAWIANAPELSSEQRRVLLREADER